MLDSRGSTCWSVGIRENGTFFFLSGLELSGAVSAAVSGTMCWRSGWTADSTTTVVVTFLGDEATSVTLLVGEDDDEEEAEVESAREGDSVILSSLDLWTVFASVSLSESDDESESEPELDSELDPEVELELEDEAEEEEEDDSESLSLLSLLEESGWATISTGTDAEVLTFLVGGASSSSLLELLESLESLESSEEAEEESSERSANFRFLLFA